MRKRNVINLASFYMYGWGAVFGGLPHYQATTKMLRHVWNATTDKRERTLPRWKKDDTK